MEFDDEHDSEVLELLRRSLAICHKAMEAEVDRETLVELGGIVQEIEAAITAIEARSGR